MSSEIIKLLDENMVVSTSMLVSMMTFLDLTPKVKATKEKKKKFTSNSKNNNKASRATSN